MKYTTANAARILEERLPPEHWADMLLCDLPDDAMETVIKRVRGMDEADAARVGARLTDRLDLLERFMNEPIAAINVRGLRLPVFSVQSSE